MYDNADVGLFTYSIEFWNEETVGFEYNEQLKNLLSCFLASIPPEMDPRVLGCVFENGSVIVTAEVDGWICNMAVREHPCGAVMEFNIDELRYRRTIRSDNPDNNFTEIFWTASKIVQYKRRRASRRSSKVPQDTCFC